MNPIYTGTWGNCHIQGIAVDDEKGFIYYSFTTKLIKSTLDGKIIGSVDGLVGHLGCIDFNKADGRVYGSLEFKNDSVGRGILKNIGSDVSFEDAFYLAVFDVDKIDRLDMDAERDGVMTAVYLREVVDDFNGTGFDKHGKEVPHRFGCSGIDGTAIGPVPGGDRSKNYIFIAYGIYGDTSRDDNDCQIILRYDIEKLKEYETPVNQRSMHRNGPASPESKYFVYTGNTTYGVQNLEYDAFTDSYIMAVYRGKKKDFPNFELFMIDALTAPETKKIPGVGIEGEMLTLRQCGEYDSITGVYGRHPELGTTGFYARGDGSYLISHNMNTAEGQCGYIYSYSYSEKDGFIKEE